MIDFMRGRVVQDRPPEKIAEWDRQHPHPLYNTLSSGHMALIQDPKTSTRGSTVYLLVRKQETEHPLVEDISHRGRPLHVHVCRQVLMSEADDVSSRGFDAIRALAEIAAEDQTTAELLHMKESNTDRQAALDNLKEFLRDQAKRTFDSDPKYSRFAREIMNEDDGNRTWGYPPYLLPYNLTIDDLPDEQVWLVDRDHEPVDST
jgi:hypothetical protein